MSNRYGGNPARDNMATFLIFDKGTYEFTISSSKPFEAKDKDGNVKNYGVRQRLICESEGGYKGKALTFTHYWHTEGGRGISKNFMMAAFGFDVKPENEEAFNNLVADKNWEFSPDDGSVGDGWEATHGARIILSLDRVTQKGDDGQLREQQKFVSFIPAK